VSRRGHSRELAIAAANGSCPRCGAKRQASQSYCLECGLRLPVVLGGLALARRTWMRRLGWYPGDWVWLALLAALLAAGGATAAITVNREHVVAAATTFVAPAPRYRAPARAAAEPNGRTAWPAALDGWTVVLGSTPLPAGSAGPLASASGAARNGLPQVGVLDSSDYSSLHPGYYVVFSGIYGSPADANTALETVRAHGFDGAYVVRVTP
jgi:hypothetical protein